MSGRTLASQAAKTLGVKDTSGLLDLSDDHLRKIIKQGKKNPKGPIHVRKRGGTVKRKSGGKIMQGYKAGGKV